MRLLFFLSFTLMLITSCATSTKIYAPDGGHGYSIDCSGGALTWGLCYEKAGNLCKEKGYEVLEKAGDEGTIISGSQFGIYGGSVTSRTLIIKCK